MDDLIKDNNGVDVILSPVTGADGLQLNVDFNFPTQYFYDLDHLSREWDLKLMDGKRHIGNAKFAAYQFMCDGVDRRTITLRHISLEPRQRGQKKSYDIARFVVQTVETECDRDWGKVYGKPVMFIEKRDFNEMKEKDRDDFFSFLKKIAEGIFGYDKKPQPTGGEVSVSVIGDNITIQLIQKHLQRSNSLEASKRGPR